MKIDYSDRALQGAIAGAISGVIAGILSHISVALNISMMRYVDYASILLLGHEPETVAQEIVVTVLSFLFSFNGGDTVCLFSSRYGKLQSIF